MALFRDTNGGIFEVDDTPNELAAARAAKWTPATKADAAEALKRQETNSLGGAAKTFAESAASSALDVAMSPVTLPAKALEALGADVPRALSRVSGRQMIEDAAGVGSELTGGAPAEAAARDYAAGARTRAEDNPISSFLGQAAGTTAALATGGIGGLAGKAGTGAAKALGGGLAARLGGAAVAGGIEGGALGMQGAQDAAYIAGRQLTGEQALASVGLTGLLGGGLSMAGKGVSELLGARRTASLAAKAGAAEGAATQAAEGPTATITAEGTASRLATPSEEAAAVAKANKGLLDTFGSVNDADTAKAMAASMPGEVIQPEAPEMYRQLTNGHDVRKSVVDGGSKALYSASTDAEKAISAETSRVIGYADKSENIRPNMPTGPEARQAIDASYDQAVAMRNKVAAVEEQIQTDFARMERSAFPNKSDRAVETAARHGAKEISALRAEIEEQALKIAGTDDATEAFMAGDQIRRRLHDKMEMISDMAKGNSLGRDSFKHQSTVMHDLYEEQVQHLFSGDIWGAQGPAQAKVNMAWPDYIAAKQNVFGKFANKVSEKLLPNGSTVPIYDMSEGALANMVGSMSGAAGRDSRRAFHHWLDATEKLGNGIRDAYGETSASKTLSDSVASIRKTFATVDTQSKALEQAEALVKRGEHSATAGILGRTADAILNPATQMEWRIKLEHLARRTDDTISHSLRYWLGGSASGAGGLLSGAAGAVGAGAKRLGPATRLAAIPTAAAFFMGSHRTPEDAYRAHAQDIIAANADNAAPIANAVTSSMGPLASRDPHGVGSVAVTATRAANYLQSKLPVPLHDPQSFTPMSAHPTPSREEIDTFARVFQAVNKPVAVVRDITNGTATVDQVDALKNVYPGMYQNIREQTLGMLRELDGKGVEVPYAKRQALDLLLDLGGAGERTLQPSFAAQYGPGIGASGGYDPKGNNAAPRSPPGPTKLGSRYGTGTSKLLGGT